MVMLEVFKENISVKYKAFLLSKATFITLVCDITAICLPFILSYHSGGLWQKNDILIEQPNVRFKGDFILLAMTSQKQKPIVCSSLSYYKKILNPLDACSSIKIREIDDNLDEKADSLHIKIITKLPNNLPIISLNLVLLLSYSLQHPCYFEMESAVIYQETNLRNGVFQVSLYADLGLQQSESLKCSKNGTSNVILPIVKDEQEFGDVFDNIINSYAARTIKTTLKNPVTTLSSLKDTSFTINLKLRYPEHQIYYKPKIWQILKFAWIQYISIYIITTWLIYQIKSYIFKHNIVLLYKDRR